MLDLGVVKPGSTIYVPVNTFSSDDPADSVTATDWANTDCHVHKNGGTTQRASSSGETLTLNFDSVNGNHLLAIDLSDNTTAGFYVAGATYHVRIEGVTVDGGTINAWIAQWRIGYPGALLDTTITVTNQTTLVLADGSANDNAYNGCVGIVHAAASAVQIAVVYPSDYAGSSKTLTLAADPSIYTMATGDNISLFPPASLAQHMLSSIATNNAVGHVTIDTGEASLTSGSAGDLVDQAVQATLGSPAGADMSADIAAVKSETATIVADTNELQTDWADGGRLDLILDARASQASVDTIDDFLDTEIAAILAAVDTEVAAIKTVTDQFTAAQSEPGAVPAANATPLEKIAWLAALARNKRTQTATTQALRNDADSANIATSTVSDDGTTATRGEWT